MKGDEALSLFCQSAFNQSHPTHGYEKLSDDIVKLAGGLPLALNVYGKLLYGKNEDYWTETLLQLQEYPEKEVLGRLEVVYARLDKNQRYVFIYIACFLKGRNIDLVKNILNNIGLHAECGITDLINKCLVTINLEDNVWMHDLLQQMCWKILCTESKRYDEKHIVIKSPEDTLTLNIQEMQTVEVINQDPYKGQVNDSFIDISKMTKLKFLRIGNVHFRKGLKYLSNDLRILEWYGCSLNSLPLMFEPKHIYEVEMCFSQLKTLWKKDLELPNLRSINLSFSKKLTKIPDLTSASNVVKLNLEGCTSLTRLHASVLLQKRLRYLNLKGCTCLKSLGRSHMEMEALEALLLSGCSKLEYIPEFGKNMKRLVHLYVDGTRIKKLPENLGEMCDLRNLDASRTFIKELPSSIYGLKKLRLLHVNRCQLSFKTGCFLSHSLDTLSSGLKEADLSYCNLSMVPDGIGLLCHLITLDLSGNEFVSLPASIGLLSKLRALCLNNCKKLQSLPKLSLVDEDMDYGSRNRFSYHISAEGVDLSKFNASQFNNHPSVSCLNCPKLAVDKRGSNLAEKILNNYLELRMKYWMTPEAVFEIVGAGSEIPSAFVQPGSEGLILVGPWIGVAICAVISVHHIDGYMEGNHMVTAHICLGGKRWKIPVSINFMAAEAETQLVFYWTEADDLQRIVGSNQKSNFNVSFSVDPADGRLHVTKFGVYFIHNECITHLKQHKVSMNSTFMHGFLLSNDFERCIAACEDDTDLSQCTRKMVDFVIDYESHDSLDVINQIIKGLFAISPDSFGVLSGCKNTWTWWHYNVIYLGVSVLYNDFIRSLKNINNGWLSVKLALEQILVKSRGDGYSYKEMLQHLNDLEAPHSVGFSENFFTLFTYVCMRKVTFLHFAAISSIGVSNSQRDKILGFSKISSILIAGVICMMVVFMDGFELGKSDMEYRSLSSVWRYMVKTFIDHTNYFRESVNFTLKTHGSHELRISDFCYNGILVQELMNKMGRSGCFTKENEDEMKSVVDKLQNNINKVSHIIQDMSSHAHRFSLDLPKDKKHFKTFLQRAKHDEIISMLLSYDRSFLHIMVHLLGPNS